MERLSFSIKRPARPPRASAPKISPLAMTKAQRTPATLVVAKISACERKDVFPFLDLPAEIRNLVYDHLKVSVRVDSVADRPVDIHTPLTVIETLVPVIRRVNRQIKQEAEDQVLKSITLKLSPPIKGREGLPHIPLAVATTVTILEMEVTPHPVGVDIYVHAVVLRMFVREFPNVREVRLKLFLGHPHSKSPLVDLQRRLRNYATNQIPHLCRLEVYCQNWGETGLWFLWP